MCELSTAEKFWTFTIVTSRSRRRECTVRHIKPDTQATKFVDEGLNALYAGCVRDILGLIVLDIKIVNVVSVLVNRLPRPKKLSRKLRLQRVGLLRALDDSSVTTRSGPRYQDGKGLVVGESTIATM